VAETEERTGSAQALQVFFQAILDQLKDHLEQY
jgi:hypothetical protein